MAPPSPPHPDLSPTDALVAVMIAVTMADETVGAAELVQIELLVETLPAFDGYPEDRLAAMGRLVTGLFGEEDGLDRLFDLARRALPEPLRETAYALACDVAASDGRITGPEALMLEEVRDELGLDRLHAAAIERGARARWQRV